MALRGNTLSGIAMNSLTLERGYAAKSLDWLWTGGRANSYAARRFLEALKSLPAEASPKNRLLHYRHDFRRLLEDRPIEVFREHLFAADPLTRSVAVWLLSRCITRFALCDIDRCCDDPSPSVRKHVAKALYRLEACQLLRDMADRYPQDGALQWFAQAKPNDIDFRDRLERFSKHSSQSQIKMATDVEPMTLWSRVEDWFLSPPKSRSYMRRVLNRIRRAVRGTY